MYDWPLVVLAGFAIGLLMGFFGVGGASVATPLLSLLGIPPLAAVASPLPATIPGAAIAGSSYLRSGEARPRAAAWSLAGGVPGTILGAVASQWVGGDGPARGLGRGPRRGRHPDHPAHRRRGPGRRHPAAAEPSPAGGRHRRRRLPHRTAGQRRRLPPRPPLRALLRAPDAAGGGHQPGRGHASWPSRPWSPTGPWATSTGPWPASTGPGPCPPAPWAASSAGGWRGRSCGGRSAGSSSSSASSSPSTGSSGAGEADRDFASRSPGVHRTASGRTRSRP